MKITDDVKSLLADRLGVKCPVGHYYCSLVRSLILLGEDHTGGSEVHDQPTLSVISRTAPHPRTRNVKIPSGTRTPEYPHLCKTALV